MRAGSTHIPVPSQQQILFVGIGNVLRQDDGVGVYISGKIRESEQTAVLTVEVSIENYIGKINRLDPDLLVLVDCMDLSRPPGAWSLLPVEQIRTHALNTHHISLKQVSEMFRMPVWVLGIQPRTTAFGETMSTEVRHTADRLVKAINQNELHFGD